MVRLSTYGPEPEHGSRKMNGVFIRIILFILSELEGEKN